MLKTKALISAALLTITMNASAFCVYNKTSDSIFFFSDQDVVTNQPKEIPTGTRHCTLPGESGFGYAITNSSNDDAQIICGALWTNVTLQAINVVTDDYLYPTCELS